MKVFHFRKKPGTTHNVLRYFAVHLIGKHFRPSLHLKKNLTSKIAQLKKIKKKRYQSNTNRESVADTFLYSAFSVDNVRHL